MEDKINQEAAGAWLTKSELEKALSAGLHGPPELKRAEKNRYLGEYKEKVVKMLTKKQVMEPGLYPEIAEALRDEKVSGLIINGDISLPVTEKYRHLAEQAGKRVTMASDPDFLGETGLIVVSDEAADRRDIAIEERSATLRGRGLPDEIIAAAGKKLCEKCRSRVLSAAPEEEINYGKISLSDIFWGEHCPACQKH